MEVESPPATSHPAPGRFADLVWTEGRGQVLEAACLLPKIPFPRGIWFLEPALTSDPLTPQPWVSAKANYPGALTGLGGQSRTGGARL